MRDAAAAAAAGPPAAAAGRLRLLSQQLRSGRTSAPSCARRPAASAAPPGGAAAEAAEHARIAAALDAEGWVALPGFHTARTCADIRDQLDRIIPMGLPGALDVVLGVNEIRHPMPEHSSGLMARLAAHPRTLRLAQSLLRCSRRELRLREQILSRTDAAPPADGADSRGAGVRDPRNFHVDAPVLPREDDATPRQVYIQSCLYASDVRGGAAAALRGCAFC